MGQMVRGAEVDYQHGVSETPGKPLWERRHSFRVQVPAHASVLHKGKLCGYYLVQDVSIGGCSLRGAPLLPIGEHLEILLHLPHRAPLALSARVQRSEARGAAREHNGDAGRASSPTPQPRLEVRAPESRTRAELRAEVRASESRSRAELRASQSRSRAELRASTPAVSAEKLARPQGAVGSMGLRFEHTPPKAEDCIQDFVVETFASAQADDGRITLVVEPRHVERQMLVRTLRELGRRAIGVATALDAVQLLGKEGEHIDTVFVEAESASLPSLELVEFLAHNYPRIRRVLVGEPSEIAASWVAQATGEVHALLETPCDQDAVHRVLHRLQFTPNDGALS
jgi:hypothetical protein